MTFQNKLLSMGLAALLSLSLAGCSGSDTSWIAQYGDTQVPAGVYLNNLLAAYSDAQAQITDSSTPVLKSQIDGVDAGQWIEDRAMDLTREYVAVEKKFDDASLTLGESELSYAEYLTEMRWSYGEKLYTANGIAKSSIQDVMENTLKLTALFQNTYGQGGPEALTDEELQKYFSENYVRSVYIALSKKGSEGALEGEALEAVKKEAQGYYDRAAAGENFDDIYLDYEKLHTDPSTVHEHTEPGMHDVLISKTDTSYPAKYLEEIFAARENVPVMFEDDSYIYVTVRRPFAEGDAASKYNAIITDLFSEDFNKEVSSWADALTEEDVTFNQNSVKRYTAKGLELDAK